MRRTSPTLSQCRDNKENACLHSLLEKSLLTYLELEFTLVPLFVPR